MKKKIYSVLDSGKSNHYLIGLDDGIMEVYVGETSGGVFPTLLINACDILSKHALAKLKINPLEVKADYNRLKNKIKTLNSQGNKDEAKK